VLPLAWWDHRPVATSAGDRVRFEPCPDPHGYWTILDGRWSLTGSDARLGQALADAATIGLLHERAVRRAETVAEQLQGALNSRVTIEQAKGVLATQGGIRPEEASTVLRSYARIHGLRLSELARHVVERTIDLTSIVRPAL
jgi:hypothetical protein